MKTRIATLLALSMPLAALSATTINALNKYAYGANIGWLDWHGNITSGAVVGEYVCSVYIYAANVGWLHLGNSTPANGIHYQNNSATDYGVNHDGLGNLRGYAYGANIGWVNFENLGGPKIDLVSGRLSGFVYGANVGWISLSNAVAFVQTDFIQPGADSDADGIPDAWELQRTTNLTTLGAGGDRDGDGVPDTSEYLADTNPLEATSKLLITLFTPAPDGTSAQIAWTSTLTRHYQIQKRPDLTPVRTSAWVDSGLGTQLPDGAATTRTLSDTGASQRFYRIRALRPLMGP
jgi:hypothetical protein